MTQEPIPTNQEISPEKDLPYSPEYWLNDKYLDGFQKVLDLFGRRKEDYLQRGLGIAQKALTEIIKIGEEGLSSQNKEKIGQAAEEIGCLGGVAKYFEDNNCLLVLSLQKVSGSEGPNCTWTLSSIPKNPNGDKKGSLNPLEPNEVAVTSDKVEKILDLFFKGQDFFLVDLTELLFWGELDFQENNQRPTINKVTKFTLTYPEWLRKIVDEIKRIRSIYGRLSETGILENESLSKLVEVATSVRIEHGSFAQEIFGFENYKTHLENFPHREQQFNLGLSLMPAELTLFLEKGAKALKENRELTDHSVVLTALYWITDALAIITKPLENPPNQGKIQKDKNYWNGVKTALHILATELGLVAGKIKVSEKISLPEGKKFQFPKMARVFMGKEADREDLESTAQKAQQLLEKMFTSK